MKKITDVITISELSRMLDLTRPTLYKYITTFEKGDYSKLSFNLVELFNFIVDEAATKRDIYDYIDKKYVVENDQMLFDKIKVLIGKDDKYRKFLYYIVNNIDELMKGMDE